ncbi:hypothetical protein [Mycolicibacterium wolinskyi]|nr:hypothetical protein [Mycolicibacterium wolinskyi]
MNAGTAIVLIALLGPFLTVSVTAVGLAVEWWRTERDVEPPHPGDLAPEN